MSKRLSLSIIIPVYNEEHHLRACLEAIARQIDSPDEVIVVDNNSTDNTTGIAKSFAFVKVVHEKKQGLIPARNRGFAVSSGDILARIDADSVLDPDWVARTRKHFADQTVGGVCGLGRTMTLPRVSWPRTTFWSRMYFLAARYVFGFQILWGANMAISRKGWEKIRTQVCLEDEKCHEDIDVSLLLVHEGFRLKRDDKLLITTAGQGYHYWPKLYGYTRRAFATKTLHQRNGTFRIHPSATYLLYVLTLPLFLLIAVPFFMISFLLWPIDGLVVRFFLPAKRWLD